MKKLLWYYGRLQTWLQALLVAGGLPEPVVSAIKIDFERCKNPKFSGLAEHDIAFLLGILVSWSESLEDGLPPAERVKIGKLLDEIKEHQKEFFS